MYWTLTIAFFITILSLSEARSLFGEHGHHRSKREKETWRPADGRDLADWLRCHGMPCEDWDEIKHMLSDFLNPEQDKTLAEISVANGTAFDGISYKPNDGTLDGCIWLTKEQTREVIANMRSAQQERETSHGGRFKRKLNTFSSRAYSKWPKAPIKYKFDGKHTSTERNIIRNGFQSWMDQTCVTFNEVSPNALVVDNHLLLTRNSTGCHSFVGRVKIVPQQLNLQYNCLWEFGIVVHEIGHALGLWHEQQRDDRDSTIRVLWQNLKAYRGQFATINTDNYGAPYDVGSVMHYAPKDGSTNGGNTMETHDPLYQKSMGQKTGLSFLDAMIINRAYCSDVCTVPLSKPCQRFGYQDPKDCTRCRCAPGFSGRYCQDVAPPRGRDYCGGTMYATKTPAYFSSPGYNQKISYENKQECNWLIQAPPGHVIQFQFIGTAFAVYSHIQNQCYHWVEVQYSRQLGVPGPRFCGYRKPTAVLTSETREMAVIFRSNWTAKYNASRTGFKVMYIAVPDPSAAAADSTTTTTTTTTTSTTTTTPPSQGPRRFMWGCEFEGYSEQEKWCSISQDNQDNFDWTIRSGSTPSQETGPSVSYDRNYIYIEASDPRRPNDQARIQLPFSGNGDYCVYFHYHMYGFHINKLSMVKMPYGNWAQQEEVWIMRKNQGNRWMFAAVNLKLKSNEKIGFIGTRGEAFSGDIAVDSIRIYSGTC